MTTLSVLIAAAVACSHATAPQLGTKILNTPISKAPTHVWIIAQKYGDKDPHGDDPHGGDPHDEQHDDKLPANAHKDDYKAPDDVYGKQFPNDQGPTQPW